MNFREPPFYNYSSKTAEIVRVWVGGTSTPLSMYAFRICIPLQKILSPENLRLLNF